MTSQKKAKEIMGKNYLSLKEVVRRSDIFFLKEELRNLPEIKFSSEILKENKHTHILFLGVDHKDGKALLKWYLIRKGKLEERLRLGWSPCLQLGGHTLPLKPFLMPLLKI